MAEISFELGGHWQPLWEMGILEQDEGAVSEEKLIERIQEVITTPEQLAKVFLILGQELINYQTYIVTESMEMFLEIAQEKIDKVKDSKTFREADRELKLILIRTEKCTTQAKAIQNVCQAVLSNPEQAKLISDEVRGRLLEIENALKGLDKQSKRITPWLFGAEGIPGELSRLHQQLMEKQQYATLDENEES